MDVDEPFKKYQPQESRKIIFQFKKIKKTDFQDNFLLFLTPFWSYHLNHLSYRSETLTQNGCRWALQKMSTTGISQNNFYKDFLIISPNSLKMRGVPLNLSKKGLMTKILQVGPADMSMAIYLEQLCLVRIY